MTHTHGTKIDIVCPCGGRGADLRITSAWKGKLTIRCSRCEHNRTLRLAGIVPDNVTVMDHMTDSMNRLFAQVEGWQKPTA
jgi:hypothetical protein